MKYKQTKYKIRKIWFGTNENLEAIKKEVDKDKKIEEAIQDGRFHLFRRMNKIEMPFEELDIDEYKQWGYKLWEIQINFIPKRFLPFIKFAIIMNKRFSDDVSSYKEVNHIVRIDEEDVGGVGIVRATLLVGTTINYYTLDPIPQVDGKLIMYIYNPEFYV